MSLLNVKFLKFLVRIFSVGRVLTVALALIAFAASAHIAVAASHPNMYINAEEIAAIKVKVDAGAQPWKGAYDKMISDAQQALGGGRYSVTFEGNTSNTFYSESPYCGWKKIDGKNPDCRDGERNPDADRKDYSSAIDLSWAMRNLGLAYAFTNDPEYAEKAITLINTWSVNPDTYMKPGAKGGGGGIIELYITMPGLFYGADLVWNYSGWDSADKSIFTDWVRSYAGYVRGKGEGLNNFANWRLVLLASAGALLNDPTLLGYVETEWKKLLPLQMNGAASSVAGIMGQEYSRSKGLSYSTYAINAMIQSAEILRHHDVNLYDYQDGAGRGIELALDFITEYVINPGSWSHSHRRQITPFTRKNSTAMYELAYSHYQKQPYLDAINRWGRPMEEIRVMGNTTLTHANRFDLNFTPVSPSIVMQPDAVTVTEGEDATFRVVAEGSASLNYQWFRDGSTIVGATGATYTLTGVSSSDDGRVYSSVVSNDEGMISSNGATLTVLSDAISPTLVSAFAVSDNRVNIVFSEPVSASGAQAIANYQVDPGIGVTFASLSSDGLTVSFTVSPRLTEDTTYRVSVSNVQDRATTPNTIVALSSKTFTYRTADDFEDGVANGWTPFNDAGKADRWEVVEDEGDSAYFLKVTDYDNLNGKRLGEYSLLSASYGDFTFTAQARLGDDADSNTHADYAVVFGFQDNENYYYVLFNNDQGSTQITVVEDGSRVELATAESDWVTDNAYHSIKVSRLGSEIKVYFDGNLIMSASDDTLGTGKVGVGSYNDSAYFDDVKVVATAETLPDTTPPVILLTGAVSQQIPLGSSYTDSGATATDNSDGDISMRIDIDVSAVDTTTAGSYRVTYNVADNEGNQAIEVVRQVSVVAVNDGDDNTVGDDNSGGGVLGWWMLVLMLGFQGLNRRIASGKKISRYVNGLIFGRDAKNQT